MSLRIVLGLSLGLVPVLLAALGWRRARVTRDIPPLRALSVGVAAALLAVGCQFIETALWQWTGLSLVALPGKEAEALLAMFLFAAPLEEGAKVLSIWPLYSARRILEIRHGIVLSAIAGLGFAVGKTAIAVALGMLPSDTLAAEALANDSVHTHALAGAGDGLAVLRAALAMPPHVISAVLWGSTLGVRANTSWFALAWTVATALLGLYEHIVLGRGPGVLVLALPLLLTLLALAYVAARRAIAKEAARRPASLRPGSDGPRSSRTGWSEPPSLREIWQALEPRHAPLMLHWIGLGTLVTAGVGLVALAAALYAGHWLGLDFAAADEADVSSNGPLVFLAVAVGLAFPVAGYLVARASGTRSVLEPALGAALAVVVAVLFLSVTTPIAAIFALALTPIAFVLASAGAWLGIGR
ncbi:MAG: PrsW family glutamic-type intramembrane protease [Deltaproteobacteria bacterium]